MGVEKIHGEIVECVKDNKLKFHAWGDYLIKGSVSDMQIDSDTYGVQVFVRNIDGYQKYEKIKEELGEIFKKHGFAYADERHLKETQQGWFRELHFTQDTNRVKDNQNAQAKVATPQIIGNVNMTNANTVIGDGNRIEQSKAVQNQEKSWFQKHLVELAIGVLGTVIAGFIIYLLGWN